MPLIYQKDPFIFHQIHNIKNEGWCILRVYLHNNQLIAVVSEKFTLDKEYDEGPDDKYAYTLTNGIEVAATLIRKRDHIAFNQLIHFTPARHRLGDHYLDPIKNEEVALIHLQWHPTKECYSEYSGLHPWESITRSQAEILIGQSLDDTLQLVNSSNLYKGVRSKSNATIFVNGHPLPFAIPTNSSHTLHEWGIQSPTALRTAYAILVYEFRQHGLEGAEEIASQLQNTFYEQVVTHLPRTEANNTLHLEEWTLYGDQIRQWIAKTPPRLHLPS